MNGPGPPGACPQDQADTVTQTSEVHRAQGGGTHRFLFQAWDSSYTAIRQRLCLAGEAARDHQGGGRTRQSAASECQQYTREIASQARGSVTRKKIASF